MRLPWINIPEEVEARAAAATLRPQGKVLGLRRKPKPTEPEAEQTGEEKTGPGRAESTVLKPLYFFGYLKQYYFKSQLNWVSTTCNKESKLIYKEQ